MKKMRLLVLFLVAVMSLYGQSEKLVDSRITDVTVFLNRAQVNREVKTRLEAGRTSLVLTGLTSLLDHQSVQVSGKGNFIIMGIEHRQNYLNEFNIPKALKTLKDSVEYLQRQVSIEQSQKEILNKEEQMLLSNQKIGGTNQNLTVAELKAMADFYRSRLSDIVVTRMKIEDRIGKISARAIKLQKQINEQNDLYARNTSEIVINLSADAATSAELDVNYVVANAGWTPEYDLRAADTKSPVQLSYKANVFQGTGEEWKNVHLVLSTANPSQGGLKPELNSWYLALYRNDASMGYFSENKFRKFYNTAGSAFTIDKEEDDRPSFYYSTPDTARTTSSFTTSIQTSLNVEFDISLPYTVNSSNKPTLVDIKSYEMKADYIYSVAPKLDADAFLMARATGWEEFNLLPGEANVFFEGTFVAKTFIDPNSVKDTLNVSLGRDKRIVVKREKLKDYTTRRFMGSNQRETYAYEISVRNTRSEVSKIIVEDQVPVSQNSEIEVAVADVGGAKNNKSTGKLSWELSLQSNETKKVAYKFEVRYPKDQIIAGL